MVPAAAAASEPPPGDLDDRGRGLAVARAAFNVPPVWSEGGRLPSKCCLQRATRLVRRREAPTKLVATRLVAKAIEALLVTFDGRQKDALGVTIFELAEFMLKLGSTSAMNLDGGGSTSLYVKCHDLVNQPSSGSERPVYDGIFVYPLTDVSSPRSWQR